MDVPSPDADANAGADLDANAGPDAVANADAVTNTNLERRDGWSLLALSPHDGCEPPADVSDELARAHFCAVSALWHPALLARARELPRTEPIDAPSAPGPWEIRVLVDGAADELPSGHQTQAEDCGAVLIESGVDRAALVERILGHMGPEPAAADAASKTQGEATNANVDADGEGEAERARVAADFMALGTVHWMLRALTIAMGHSDSTDREGLERELFAGARAWRVGDHPTAVNRLRAAFEVLTQARERFYPVDAYLLDLCLLDPGLPGGVLAGPLATPVPITFIAPGAAIEGQAAADPERIAALRQAIHDGWADVAGGSYTEAEDALAPLESIVWQFQRARAAYRAHLDERDIETFARRRFGLFVQLPQIARRFGIRYGLHLALDGGRFPIRAETKRLWEAPEGSSLEGLLRPPLAADRPSQGWRLPWRIGASMRDDHVAAVPLVHWPAPVAAWYEDLRRVATYSPVLARWATLSDFFQLTDRPYDSLRPEMDAYATPYLAQAVSRRESGPVSRMARHHQQRAQLDAARVAQAFSLALERAAGPSAASETTAAEDVPGLETLEERIELGTMDEAAPELELERATAAWSASLARRIVGKGRLPTEARRGCLVMNPLGFARRVAVVLPGAAANLAAEGPLLRAQLAEEGVCAVVDLPAFGFAWVPLETVGNGGSGGAAAARTGGAVSARERTLSNESMEVEIDAATGGLRGIIAPGEPMPRLGQQLAIVGLRDELGKPYHSQMRCERFDLDYNGPALAQATAAGGLFDPREGRKLAAFQQRYRLWSGRRTLEIEVSLSELDPAWLERAARSDPWSFYLACRWAWPDANAMLRRTALGTPEITEVERPETPDALDIATRSQRTAVLFGGLPYHRKPSGRMLDTLLVAGMEACRSFSFGVVLDQEHPFPAAQDLLAPALVAPIENGPPPVGATGWLAQLDARNIAITRVEFVENAGDRGWGLVFHLIETAGRSARCRLRLFRDPTWARQVDFLGETIIDLSTEGDAVQVDLTAYEFARVEVALG